MFIMVAIVYKSKKLYGYRIVNYIENQKQQEIKDCSINQIKLAFSRGAKIDNLEIKHDKLVITKGLASQYDRIGISNSANRRQSNLIFGYVIRKDKSVVVIMSDGLTYAYNIDSYNLEKLRESFMVPNIGDFYGKYTGKQLQVNEPKGVISINTLYSEQVKVTVSQDYSIRVKRLLAKGFSNRDISYIDRSKRPLIGGYLVDSLSLSLNGSYINKYKGLSDLIEFTEPITAYGKLIETILEYQGNIFSKACSEPVDLEKYNKIKKYTGLPTKTTFKLTCNKLEPIALCREVSEQGIKYVVKLADRKYWESIEMIFYNIINGVYAYPNVIVKDSMLIVYGLDGVIMYDMDRIHNEYKGKIRESERSISNRLLGIEHTELVNDRNEILKLSTESENVIIDDNIVKLEPNSVIIVTPRNRRLIIGKNVVECKDSIEILGFEKELEAFEILVKCKPTAELFREIGFCSTSINLNNQELEFDMASYNSQLLNAHNYRLRVSVLQQLIRLYNSDSAREDIMHVLDMNKMTIKDVNNYENPTENFIYVE